VLAPLDDCAPSALLHRYLAAQRGAALSMAVLLAASTGLDLAAPQAVRAARLPNCWKRTRRCGGFV